MLTRRSMLTGLGAMLAAPAVVHAGNLMPVSARNLGQRVLVIPQRWLEAKLTMDDVVEVWLDPPVLMLREEVLRMCPEIILRPKIDRTPAQWWTIRA